MGFLLPLLTLAGTAASEYANVSARNKMNDTVSAEEAQQQQYQKQAQNVLQQSIAQSTPAAAQQQIGQGQQQLAGLISNTQAVPMSASMPSISSSSALGDVNSKTNAAKAQMSNTAASNFGGYSNYGLQQYLKDLQAKSQLGVINQNASGWANILPAQLQQASQSQSGISDLGTLLSTAGKLGGVYSATSAPSTNYMSYPGTASMLNGIAQQNVLNPYYMMGNLN
jgi:hypothetical protein